jgi:hypothetical protein
MTALLVQFKRGFASPAISEVGTWEKYAPNFEKKCSNFLYE